MGNIFQMIKQATTMQKQMRQIQRELASCIIEYETGAGKVKVVASGDMSIKQITVDHSIFKNEPPEKICRLITEAVNGAIEKAKKESGERMTKMMGGGEMSGLLDMFK